MVKATLVDDSLLFYEGGGGVQNFSVTFDKSGVDIDAVGKVAAKSGQVYKNIVPLSLLEQEAAQQKYEFVAIKGKFPDKAAVENFIRDLNLGIWHY